MCRAELLLGNEGVADYLLLLRNEGVEDFLLPFPHSSVLRLKGPGTKGQEYRLPKRHAVDLQTSAATQQREESTNQDENAPCKIWLITLQFQGFSSLAQARAPCCQGSGADTLLHQEEGEDLVCCCSVDVYLILEAGILPHKWQSISHNCQS